MFDRLVGWSVISLIGWLLSWLVGWCFFMFFNRRRMGKVKVLARHTSTPVSCVNSDYICSTPKGAAVAYRFWLARVVSFCLVCWWLVGCLFFVWLCGGLSCIVVSFFWMLAAHMRVPAYSLLYCVVITLGKTTEVRCTSLFRSHPVLTLPPRPPPSFPSPPTLRVHTHPRFYFSIISGFRCCVPIG